MDLDRDGILSEADIDTYMKRLNFKDFFEGRSKSTDPVRRATSIATVNSFGSVGGSLFPTQKMGIDKLEQVLR